MTTDAKVSHLNENIKCDEEIRKSPKVGRICSQCHEPITAACIKDESATCCECLELFDPKKSKAKDNNSFCSDWCESRFFDQEECERVAFSNQKR